MTRVFWIPAPGFLNGGLKRPCESSKSLWIGSPPSAFAPVPADDSEELPVKIVTEKPRKDSRLRANITEKRAARVRILRKVGRITRAIAAAILILKRGLGSSEERLFRKVYGDLQFLFVFGSASHGVEVNPPIVPPKEDLKAPADSKFLHATPRLTDKQQTIVELPRLDEDPAAEDEPLKFGHQGFRGLPEHSLLLYRCLILRGVVKAT